MDRASAEPPHKDYYKVLEVDYDASDDTIKLSYRRLALKWHPDKHKGDNDVTAKFQEINEAYKVLSDPAKRLEYDFSGCYEINRYTLRGPIFEGIGAPLINSALTVKCVNCKADYAEPAIAQLIQSHMTAV